MAIKRKLKPRGYKDNKGYLKSNKENHTPVKFISGGDITMEGVDFPVIAMPIGKDGKPMGIKFMKKGQNYNFDGASEVMEVPVYSKGGRYTLPKYQTAGTNTQQQWGVENPFSLPNLNQNELFQMPAKPVTSFEDLTNINPLTGQRNPAPTPVVNPAEPTNNITPEAAPKRAQVSSVGASDIKTTFKDLQDRVQVEETSGLEKMTTKTMEDFEPNPIENPNKTQLFNPYGGVDIPSAAYLFGQSVGKGGDPLMAVASGMKLATGLGRNIASGVGAANLNAQGAEEYNRKIRRGIIDQSIQYGQEGGQMPIDIQQGVGNVQEELEEEELTGNKAYGTEGAANVELEKGEFFKNPQGIPVKVLGDTHEKGGEKFNLEQGAQIISDHLKINKQQAKQLKEEFDIDISTKDTYAKALDKFNSKTGLNSLIEEEEKLIEQAEKEKEKLGEKGASEATHNLNLEFISQKINEITEAKKPLEILTTTMFDRLFELQESTKKTEDTEQDMFEVGGTVYSKGDIISLASKYNIPEKRAFELLKSMQPGGTQPEPVASKRGFVAQSQDENTGLYGEVTPEVYQQFVRVNSSWFDFRDFDPRSTEDVMRFQEAYNQRTTGNKITVDGKLGNQTASVIPSFKPNMAKINSGVDPLALIPDADMAGYQNFRNTPANPESKTPGLATPGIVSNDIERRGKGSSNVMLLPDQTPLPPQGLIMPTKMDRRYGRLEPQLISPDEQLTEINRQVDAAMKQLENLPSGARESAIVQLQANAASQSNKVVTEVERYNNQLLQNADAFNVRQGDREEDARVMDTMSFEQRAQGAMANTEDDFRRFFNTAQERNVQNFNLINSLNLLNENYENFDYMGDGVNVTGTPNLQEYMIRKLTAAQAYPQTQPKENRYGGRNKTKRY